MIRELSAMKSSNINGNKIFAPQNEKYFATIDHPRKY